MEINVPNNEFEKILCGLDEEKNDSGKDKTKTNDNDFSYYKKNTNNTQNYFVTLKNKSEIKLNDNNIINNVKDENLTNDNNFSANDNLSVKI